jgi:hypothetical protein
MPPDFFSYHKSLVDELKAVKNRIRTLIPHWPTDGAFKEATLRSVLRRHLPESLMVAHGFVVSEHETSTEIDILIIDRGHQTLFKDGDLVIVSADAVRAMIEVKTNLDGPSKVKEALVKLCSNDRVCFNAGQARRIWTGLFVYNGRDDRDEVLLRSLQAAWEQTGMEANCISFGPNTWVVGRRGALREDISGRRVRWQSWITPGHAPTYFLGNLLRHIAGIDDKSGGMVWTPASPNVRRRFYMAYGEQEPRPDPEYSAGDSDEGYAETNQ